MVVILASKVKEEHFSIPLVAVRNSFNASCSLAMITHPLDAIDHLAHKGVVLGLECCNECALATLCMANDTEGLSSGEGGSLLDGFVESSPGYVEGSLRRVVLGPHTGSCLSQEYPTLDAVVGSSNVKGSVTIFTLNPKIGPSQDELLHYLLMVILCGNH